MDIQTIDQQYQQLQSQAQQTAQELSQLANKLQTAAQAGNQDAREWMLDLKSVALAIQAEQNQVNLLLQALHAFVANQPPSQPPVQQPSPWGQQQPLQQQPYSQGYGQPAIGAGGMLNSFLNSGFGRAIEMGAGFGLGDDLINKLF